MIRPGLLTTVQDRGRLGYQKFGVPVAGALDDGAFRVANLLVGNPPDAAALEFTALGPSLRVVAETVIAVAGADMAGALDGYPLPAYEAVAVYPGQVLDWQGCQRGARTYLAVAGGIDVPLVLRSRSTCLSARFGGHEGRALRERDRIATGHPAGPVADLVGRTLPEGLRPIYDALLDLRVVMGPQDDRFTPDGTATFLASEYRVTPNADRMGYRLEGPAIAHVKGADIISDAIAPGAIQVPGDGKPIVLLADRQTTGGYAKIATVIGPDIPRVAQGRPGDGVRFRAVSLEEAHRAHREREAFFAALPAQFARLPQRRSYALEVDGVPYEVDVEEKPGGYAVTLEGKTVEVDLREPTSGEGVQPEPGISHGVRSPVAGVVGSVAAHAGQRVRRGERLLTLQAMKMEHGVDAPGDGMVAEVLVTPGIEVRAGDVLVRLAPPPVET